MRDALDDLIEAFDLHLPRIISQYGHGWMVFAGQGQVAKFGAFPDAARYARQHYGTQQVLIRHTDERQTETAPFIETHSGRN